MYLEHFGLTEPPFRITPHTDFFFSGGNRGATLDALIYAITHDQGIVKISGEVGSGKTMLCRVLMERLPESVTFIYLANPSLSREDILYAIADELHLDVPENARAAIVLKALQEHLIRSYSEGRQVVVLVDEAHAMPVETLEEIRLLSNLESNHSKLLQLVLFGQPELNDVLARPDMRQLKERITHNFMLEPLVHADVAQYIEFRMRAAGYKGPSLFSAPAIKLIARVSLGLTRRINILADKALLAAFAEGTHEVGLKQAQIALKDCDFSTATYLEPKGLRRSWHPAYIAVLVAAIGILAAWTTFHSAQTPQEISPPPTDQTAPASSQATASPPPNTTPAPPPAAPETAPVNESGQLTQQRLEAGNAWLAKVPDKRWFLQLYANDASKIELVESYLKAAGAGGVDMQQIRVYRSSLSGKERMGVIYGDYESRSEAIGAAEKLPNTIRLTKPYPRQVAKLR
jgi:type II secretory pathway predicted ATPase ExeA